MRNNLQEINHIIQKMNIIFSQNQQRFTTNQQKIAGILINQILFVNQIFLNSTHEMQKHDNQDKIFLQNKTHTKTIIFKYKFNKKTRLSTNKNAK